MLKLTQKYILKDWHDRNEDILGKTRNTTFLMLKERFTNKFNCRLLPIESF
jgi:hypothetical protein